jgi:hypothetical protein
MTQELINELKELREMINQSSEHTQRQLQNIDSNLLIGSILSLILALGASFQLKILVYWVPASFLLMYLWALFSLISTRKNFTPEKIDVTIKGYKEMDKSKLEFGFFWFLRNMSPLTKAVSIIYGITSIVLILIINKTININVGFPPFIPFISALLFLFLPFFLDNLTKFFERDIFSEFVEKFNLLKEKAESKGLKIINIIKAVFLILYLPIVVLLPLWALLITYPLISDFLFLVLVLVLQSMVVVIFTSYFSTLLVKKELTNSITNFSDLNYQINDLLLNREEINKDIVQKLKKLYLTAKQYDVLVDDSFKFVNIYYLLMHRVYLKRK